MNIEKYTYLQERFLPRLTSAEVKAMDKDDALLILPVGATEQHGPHLPTYTDAILVESMINESFKHLDPDENVWVLPTLAYGKSNEHMDRPGTFTLSSDTLKSILIDICRSTHKNGFKRLALFNGHGGNLDTLKLIARDVRIETGIMIFIVHIGALDVPEDVVTKEEMLLGIHAGDYETSLMLHDSPKWVKEDLLVKETPNLLEKSDFLRFQSGNLAWTIDDVSESGVVGDATIATREKGAQLYERQGKQLSDIFLDIKNFDSDSLI